MAKKSSISTSTPTDSIFDLVSSVDKSAEIIANSKTAVIKDYIKTGSYILNAAMTGSIFKGAPSGRVVTLAGDPGSGKSFLAISMCREGQKQGYTPIYMDSEGAIDIEFITRLGCDPHNFIIKQVTTISEVATFMTNVLKKINEKPEDQRDKVIFVLDSLGNLTSDKELTDTLDANQKRDMTKQQEIKALFRTVATSLSKAQALMVVCSHIYKTLDLFSKNVVSGGSGISYNSSVTLMLSVSKLDDKESDKIAENKVGEFTKTGVIVTATPQKSRFIIPQKVQFQIPFFKAPNPYIGLEKYLTWDHDGIMEGILLDSKSFDKLSPNEKSSVQSFEYNGETMYAFPKIAGIQKNRKIVVKHLGQELPLTELWSSKVLTDELLHKLDDDIIRPLFELPTQDTDADLDELIDSNLITSRENIDTETIEIL